MDARTGGWDHVRWKTYFPFALRSQNDRRAGFWRGRRIHPTTPPPALHGARADDIAAPVRTGLSSLRPVTWAGYARERCRAGNKAAGFRRLYSPRPDIAYCFSEEDFFCQIG